MLDLFNFIYKTDSFMGHRIKFGDLPGGVINIHQLTPDVLNVLYTVAQHGACILVGVESQSEIEGSISLIKQMANNSDIRRISSLNDRGDVFTWRGCIKFYTIDTIGVERGFRYHFSVMTDTFKNNQKYEDKKYALKVKLSVKYGGRDIYLIVRDRLLELNLIKDGDFDRFKTEWSYLDGDDE